MLFSPRSPLVLQWGVTRWVGGFLIVVATISLRAENRQTSERERFAVKQIADSRRTEMEQFKQSLEAAKTSEDKRAVLKTFRAQAEARHSEKVRQTHPAKSSQEALAEMKARTARNPEMQQRMAKMEARLEGVELMKRSLEKIRTAEGEERHVLMAEFQEERKNLFGTSETARQARKERVPPLSKTADDLAKLPPEMRVMRQKAEERKREVEDLHAALKQADAAERSALLGAFREKQDIARAERVVSLKSQAPTKTQP